MKMAEGLFIKTSAIFLTIVFLYESMVFFLRICKKGCLELEKK